VEAAVIATGATPATLALIDGVIHVGVDEGILERLARDPTIGKAGTRDIGWGLATRSTLATTVGSSLTIAHSAGIQVLATGGIGGVHRGAEDTGDVSNDLWTLARTPVVTVCSGIKSILDVPRTLEYLETVGVPLVGYGTNVLPDFYCRESAHSVPAVDGAETVAHMVRAQAAIGLDTGIIVANPPPVDSALDRTELDALVEAGVQEAQREGVRGKAVTPFMLRHIADQTSGRSVRVNTDLLVSNARVASEIALAISAL